ncbi:activator of the mannose operon (transcriptional antiterminator) [Sporomusaceae bacterium BoRhaA]|uniref:BglG family transcription antiterminator n=1 Tax=Pelorhabdus rhamnosifermentans TaxID=2772457 RepID=UPI001C060692|nr:transcription antiterminator [Pelorhabdus rhamnosifermentans]MBU2701254.1 activator of the mannose operon (transcriptional antiterminator) [Pelorhabdus rhamnosifermentans]
MESLTTRETKSLTFLAKSDGYVSADRLADFLNVSKKTIYRDIVSIKKKMGNDVIKQSKGKGFRIELSSLNIINHNNMDDYRQNHFLGMTAAERRKNLLILLLLQSPQETSIKSLSEYYYVSNASIVNDLNSIEKQLGLYKLTMIRSHKGTYINGKEKDIRKMLMHIFEYLPGFFQGNLNLDREGYHYIFKEISNEDLDFVGHLFNDTENMLHASIKDPYCINIFTHLIILIKRLRNSSFKADYEILQEKDTEIKNEQIFQVAQYIIQQINTYINLEVPEIEVFYIYQYLISSGCGMEVSEQFTMGITPKDSKEKEITFQLIHNVSRNLNVDFINDVALQQNLFLHMRSLLKRVQYDISVCNPLLQEIKKEFSIMFEIVRRNLAEQTIFSDLRNISDDEISYIVIYFQASLEKQPSVRRVLIVCSSGVGTSHLLKNRVKNAFPEWEIVGTISANHIAQVLDNEKIDLILTTIQLKIQKDIPIILVSALFNRIDILKVRNVWQTYCERNLIKEDDNEN